MTDLPDGERSAECDLPCDEENPLDATGLPGHGREQSRRGATDLPGGERDVDSVRLPRPCRVK